MKVIAKKDTRKGVKIKWLILAAVLIVALIGLFFLVKPGRAKENLGSMLYHSFEANFTMNTGDMEFKGLLSRDEAGKYTIQMLEPEELQNLNISIENQTVLVGFEDVSFDFESEQLPLKNCGLAISQAIENLLTQDVSVLVKHQMVNAMGRTDNVKYEFEIDEKNKFLRTLRIPDYDMTITFSNFVGKNEEARTTIKEVPMS